MPGFGWAQAQVWILYPPLGDFGQVPQLSGLVLEEGRKKKSAL